jgi:release factor glutamine methyltransferase
VVEQVNLALADSRDDAATESASDVQLRLLDLCTGSGCLLLSALLWARARSWGVQGVGLDISPAALDVSRANASALLAQTTGAALKTPVHADFVECDLLSDAALAAAPLLHARQFNVIVSNPPYLTHHDMEHAHGPQGPLRFEPSVALAGGADGLVFYRRLAAVAPALLRPAGQLVLEVGSSQAQEVAGILTDGAWGGPPLQLLRVTKDLNGLDRCLTFRRRSPR